VTARTHRVFIASPPLPDGTVVLAPDRSHYLVRVLRLRRGTTVLGVPGDGCAYALEIEDASSVRCVLRNRGLAATEDAPEVRVHLAQSLIKGERLDWVVQKATELGITDLWLVAAAHGEVRLDGRRLDNRLEHWRAVVASACEQSGRLWLPEIHAPMALDELVRNVAAQHRVLLDPGAPALPALWRADTLLVVGPEGGWSDDERRVAQAAGLSVFGLGEIVLRADTAPVAALAALRHGWGWRRP